MPITLNELIEGSGAQPIGHPIAANRLLDGSAVFVTSMLPGANVDAFGRQRVGTPQNVFDAQFTYDLKPLLYEQITSGVGAAITHDTTNRAALMAFTAETAVSAYMQSFEYLRYQPGKSQAVAPTFNMIEAAAGVVKFARYGDEDNAIAFELTETGPQFAIKSLTDNGNETAVQANWNLDKLDGTGASGLTLDISKTQILEVDFQALYVGRVRLGFNINGETVYAHEFDHANNVEFSYIQTANLPLSCGMVADGVPANTTMYFFCGAVISEGGQEDIAGETYTKLSTVTAGSGVRTHALSLRPKALFNTFVNRSKFVLDSVEIAVAGNSPVRWQLSIGQAISGTTTYADVNATYSSMEFNTAGTLSGNPAIVVAAGTVAASNQSKSSSRAVQTSRYPITLNAAGAARALGTLTLDVTGVGGASACDCYINWREVR